MNSTDKLPDTSLWRSVFDAEARPHVLDFRVTQMLPRPSDVFTGKLTVTRAYLESIRSGAVRPLRDTFHHSMDTAIDIIRMLSAHSRIARTGDLQMIPPAFWTKALDGEGGARASGRLLPVMPLSHLSCISSVEDAPLRHLLRLLHEDGAVRLVQNQAGVLGVMISDGYVSDIAIRGFLRH